MNLELSLHHWVNDFLMAVFFFLVGLEIEREVYIGELSELRNASLPIFGALGGVVVPALIYLAFTTATPLSTGFGIPMATDIAFALGMLSLLGSRVPIGLKVFLTALAIIDDLCAILVIALFYSDNLQWTYLAAAGGILGFLFLLNRVGMHRVWVYLLLGLPMWYCMFRSGVHATLAGVLLAFVIPFGNGDTQSPSYHLQHVLHKPVAFLVMPIFALANTGLVLSGFAWSSLIAPHTLGIIIGLVVGKPVGIVLFCYLTSRLGWARLPENVNWRMMWAVGLLAGIGFTMSIFITLLAFNQAHWVQEAKIAILSASSAAAALGLIAMKKVTSSSPSPIP